MEHETRFIADLHLEHRRVCAFHDQYVDDWRAHGYPDIEKFNHEDGGRWSEFVRKNWNETVGTEDETVIVGDCGLGNKKIVIEVLESLNGKKYLIPGNHDEKLLRDPAFRRLFVQIGSPEMTYHEIFIFEDHEEERNISVTFSHYPILAPPGHNRFSVNLCGHIHNTWPFQEALDMVNVFLLEKGIPHRQINVGIFVPYMQFKPQKFGAIMKAKDIYAGKALSYHVYRVR